MCSRSQTEAHAKKNMLRAGKADKLAKPPQGVCTQESLIGIFLARPRATRPYSALLFSERTLSSVG